MELKHDFRRDEYPEYGVWKNMRRRCNDRGNKRFARYGGRGITICQRWDDFYLFLSDMGARPTAAHQIDRIDNNAGYSPENCRWTSPQEQARNRASNRLVQYKGRRMTLTEACGKSGLGIALVWARLRLGWSTKTALSTPARKMGWLTPEQKKAIREDSRTMREISEAYCVGITTVWRIKRRTGKGITVRL